MYSAHKLGTEKIPSRRKSVPEIILPKKLSKPARLSKEEEMKSMAERRKKEVLLPPLKYKFLEQMKHQLSALERDSPNIFTR